MSEWQPARIRNAHGKPCIKGDPKAHLRVVRVRPTHEDVALLISYKRCDARFFFDLHPEDNAGKKTVLCEHEVISD